MADLLCLRAEGMTRAGEVVAARECYGRAAEFARRSGAPEVLAAVRHGLGELSRLTGDLAGARGSYESALSACTSESFGVAEIKTRVLVGLGRVAEAEGRAAAAVAYCREALTAGAGDPRGTADVAECLAGLALLDGDGERSALLLGAGSALRGMSVAGDRDVARVAGRAKALLGDAAYASAYARGAAMPREEAMTLVGSVSSGS